ncbi:septum formation initiator family protein [Clostridium sp.]|uniref:septum formation initiator family protein n=1 Tax=Clostridium sp. TaxID=1506 RepID=UPI002FC73A6C
MLLENESNSIYGNTVLASQGSALPKEKVKKQEEVKKKQQQKQEQQERLFRALKFAGTLATGFTLAFTILFRYSAIYTTQKELSEVNSAIYNLTEENEALKVQLIKYNNISYIEEVATKELKMVNPIAGNAIYCNLKSIELPLEEKKAESTSIALFKKIKGFLF